MKNCFNYEQLIKYPNLPIFSTKDPGTYDFLQRQTKNNILKNKTKQKNGLAHGDYWWITNKNRKTLYTTNTLRMNMINAKSKMLRKWRFTPLVLVYLHIVQMIQSLPNASLLRKVFLMYLYFSAIESILSGASSWAVFSPWRLEKSLVLTSPLEGSDFPDISCWP